MPALKAMAQSSTNQLARIHAMWTLEGLQSLDAAFVRALDERHDLPDPHPGDSRERVAVKGVPAPPAPATAASKAAAAKTRGGDRRAGRRLVRERLPRHGQGQRPERRDPGDADLNILKVPQAIDLIRATSTSSSVRGIKEIGAQILQPGRSLVRDRRSQTLAPAA